MQLEQRLDTLCNVGIVIDEGDVENPYDTFVDYLLRIDEDTIDEELGKSTVILKLPNDPGFGYACLSDNKAVRRRLKDTWRETFESVKDQKFKRFAFVNNSEDPKDIALYNLAFPYDNLHNLVTISAEISKIVELNFKTQRSFMVVAHLSQRSKKGGYIIPHIHVLTISKQSEVVGENVGANNNT